MAFVSAAWLIQKATRLCQEVCEAMPVDLAIGICCLPWRIQQSLGTYAICIAFIYIYSIASLTFFVTPSKMLKICALVVSNHSVVIIGPCLS